MLKADFFCIDTMIFSFLQYSFSNPVPKSKFAKPYKVSSKCTTLQLQDHSMYPRNQNESMSGRTQITDLLASS